MAVNEQEPTLETGIEKPLRLLAPRSYSLLLQELEALHLHPYDVKASAIAADAGLTIVLRYGEELTQKMEQSFTSAELAQPSPAISEFFHAFGEACKKAIIADYFKMIKL